MRGFTPVEAVVAVALAGIAVSLAYPAYSDFLLRERVADATQALNDLQTQLDQYHHEHHTYVSTAEAVSPCTSSTAVRSFIISCPVLEDSRYTLQARGRGLAAGFSYTLDYQDVKTSKVPTIWGGATSACWVLRRGAWC
jgi:type IV pilus assembly protein PilE